MDINNIENLTEHQLKTVIRWIWNDLNAWSKNDDVIESTRLTAAMWREALEYQVDKAYQKNLSTEEQ